jgi:hypothetical protein
LCEPGRTSPLVEPDDSINSAAPVACAAASTYEPSTSSTPASPSSACAITAGLPAFRLSSSASSAFLRAATASPVRSSRSTRSVSVALTSRSVVGRDCKARPGRRPARSSISYLRDRARLCSPEKRRISLAAASPSSRVAGRRVTIECEVAICAWLRAGGKEARPRRAAGRRPRRRFSSKALVSATRAFPVPR